ncbi:MAG: PCRF domain-containing protein, partial [Bacteroidia bacterium]|nr:PCRF domain-containing protein [Bacteroidia bacterium]
MRLGGIFDIDGKLKKTAEEEKLTEAPDFWNAQKEAQNVMRSIKQKKKITEAFDNVNSSVEDLAVLYDFFKQGEASEAETDKHYRESLKMVENLEFSRMLGAEEDIMGAVVNINSGAGGTESQDWAS